MSSPDPDNLSAGRKRGLSALAATSLALVVLAAGIAVWLAVTQPPPTTERPGPESGVTVTLGPAGSPPAPSAPRPPPEAGTAADSPALPAPAGDAPTQSDGAGGDAASTSTTREPAREAAPQQPRAEDQRPDLQPSGNQDATAAVRSLPPPADGLAKAPDPALVEPSPRFGRLPKVSPDGRRAWQAYARPFDANDPRPRISIIIMNLGLSSAATEAAIQRLPGAVSLSFSPYARGLEQWIALARAAEHEVLLDLPMEPINFPANNPGPDTLLTSLTSQQNRTRMYSLLGRVTGYVGVVNQMGSRFTTSGPHPRPILVELRDRGLLFVDSRSSLRSVAAQTASEIGLPRVINNRFIDAEASRSAIDERLEELERIARISGYAVGIGEPFPVTIDRLVRWTRSLDDKNLTLAPASAMVNVQPD